MPRTRPPFAEKPVFDSLEHIARDLRLKVVEAAGRTKRNLEPEALAVSDILVALFWQSLRIDPKYPDSPARDRLIFNREPATLAYYAALAKRGFFPVEDLDHFDEPGGRLPLHLSPGCAPGVEWGCGSAHHGLSVGLGMALASALQARNFGVCVLADESACLEGVVLESAQIAARLRLGNLTAVITTQARPAGGSRSPYRHPLAARWQALGWNVREVDGHDLNSLVEILVARKPEGPPNAILAAVIPGRGLSFVQAEGWTGRPPTPEEIEAARKELLP